MLPAGFGRRADGSRLELTDGRPDRQPARRTGNVRADSRHAGRADHGEREPAIPGFSGGRGRVGRRPIRCWSAFDNRRARRSGLEHVAHRSQAAPLDAKQHVDFLNRWLGPPATQRLAPVAGNLVIFEAAMRGGGKVAGRAITSCLSACKICWAAQLPADDRPLLEALRRA